MFNIQGYFIWYIKYVLIKPVTNRLCSLIPKSTYFPISLYLCIHIIKLYKYWKICVKY